ncbi:DUF1643 domain-containing protein [uncultured Vagococcus sp.]|uniref:DUF1643 domain-containing protein n=1 Tax=uncultured Vagococcus sp. TaxID=189676 RepID=UPI0028D8D3DF|nr:DUF1643 domain-containing protein [uncultured Vagococcus sp.]
MKNSKATFKVEAQLSDDGKHRYSYMKKWDTKKPMATVITIYPGSDDVLKEDLTTMLITNQLITDYGGFYLVNLFSKLGLNKMKLGNEKELNDSFSDDVIQAFAEATSDVILAWGSVTQLKVGAKRAEEVEKLVAETGNVRMLTDSLGKTCYHPLSPKVRKKWYLK